MKMAIKRDRDTFEAGSLEIGGISHEKSVKTAVSADRNAILTDLQRVDRDFWMEKAFEVSQKSLCILAPSHIGAVAVRDGHVIASGTNGPNARLGSCADRGYCIRRRLEIKSGTQREVAYCICAEQRMICNAAREGIELEGAEVYITHKPCAVCVRLMIESGIARVFYKNDYPQSFTDEIATTANFELIKI
jgi:dCMP deaminase